MPTRLTRIQAALAFAVALIAAYPLSAQAQPAPAQTRPAQPSAPQGQPPATAFAAADKLPFDPAVSTGTLPNGLTYYIRRNTRPEKRVSLQLAVKAGSVDEEDDQQGLAHFVEHMAFNGSRHFKPGELISTFESTGARLGPHVNAYTGFDETVFMFTLPTDREGIVNKGIQALSDFAGGLSLDPAEIDKERGVVIEEWRGGLGASSRLRDQQIPVLYYKSKYAERLPIGKPEVLRSFTPDRLRAFYTKWYRPDRMALIVVGDIDPAVMLAMVKAEFGALAQPATPAPDRVYEVPLQSDLLIKVATDPEAQQSSVSLIRKKARLPQDRIGDYRRDLVHRLVFQMINDRFDELSRKPDAQFLGAGADESRLSPTVGTFSMSAAVENGKLPAGLSILEIESNRIKEFGFGAAELERARKWMMASYERAYSERDKSESGSYAQEYVNHFLEGEPSPGIDFEYRLAKDLIPSITAAEVGDAARRLFSDESRVILAVAAQKEGVPATTDAQLRDALKGADAAAVTAWNDTAATAVLMEHPPESAAVVDRRTVPELGVTIVRFANGVEGWFKPTDFKNDQVLFSLTASGGASLAPAPLYPEATLAPAFVQLSGVGGHSAVDLQKLLAGKIAAASPFVSTSSHGISGSSTPANLETALQLLNLNFTAPGNDPQAFALIRKQLEASYANRDNNPALLFREKVAEVNSSHHFTSQPLTLDRIAKLDPGAMASFYKGHFANAADFTFFMVGAFTVEEAIPQVARYVGSLPSIGKATSSFADLGIKFPAATERVVVEKGREPRAQTVLSFFADPPIEETEQTRVAAAADVLEIALRDILREELGETYNVSAGLSQALPQRGGGHISINFGASPDNIDKMIERTLQEVTRLQKEGPSEDLVNRAKETARREHETALRQNGFWLGRLQSAKLLGRDPLLILKREDRIAALTAANIQAAFRSYFPTDRITVVTLMPEKK
jgi:zinc protease